MNIIIIITQAELSSEPVALSAERLALEVEEQPYYFFMFFHNYLYF